VLARRTIAADFLVASTAVLIAAAVLMLPVALVVDYPYTGAPTAGSIAPGRGRGAARVFDARDAKADVRIADQRRGRGGTLAVSAALDADLLVLTAALGDAAGGRGLFGARGGAAPRDRLAGLARAAIEVGPALDAPAERRVAAREARGDAVRVVGAPDARMCGHVAV